jgi:hypothetical protein
MSQTIKTEDDTTVTYTVTPDGQNAPAIIKIYKESGALRIEYTIPWDFIPQKTWQEYVQQADQGI